MFRFYQDRIAANNSAQENEAPRPPYQMHPFDFGRPRGQSSSAETLRNNDVVSQNNQTAMRREIAEDNDLIHSKRTRKYARVTPERDENSRKFWTTSAAQSENNGASSREHRENHPPPNTKPARNHCANRPHNTPNPFYLYVCDRCAYPRIHCVPNMWTHATYSGQLSNRFCNLRPVEKHVDLLQDEEEPAYPGSLWGALPGEIEMITRQCEERKHSFTNWSTSWDRKNYYSSYHHPGDTNEDTVAQVEQHRQSDQSSYCSEFEYGESSDSDCSSIKSSHHRKTICGLLGKGVSFEEMTKLCYEIIHIWNWAEEVERESNLARMQKRR